MIPPTLDLLGITSRVHTDDIYR